MPPLFVRLAPISLIFGLLASAHAASPLRTELADDAQIAPAAEWVLTHPGEGSRAIKHGFRTYSENTYDWSEAYGLTFDVRATAQGPRTLEVDLVKGDGETVTAHVPLPVAVKDTWSPVILPWSAFDYERGRTSSLCGVRSVHVRAPGATEAVALRHFAAVAGARVSLSAPILGQAAGPDGTAVYNVTVGNPTLEPQSVLLSLDRPGWQSFATTIEPASLQLAPGESREVVVRVTVPARVPAGGHERQLLRAIASGDGANAATLTFTTSRAVPSPFLLHTPARWEEVRQKVRDFPWAREQRDEIVSKSAAWRVPAIATPPDNDPDDTMGPFLFKASEELNFLNAGIAWQLSRDTAHAAKIRELLLKLSDPVVGYAKTFRACNQALVQEGHFLQHLAMAYDMTLDSGLYSSTDRAQIDATFRLMMETMDRATRGGYINNWNLSELCGAFYSSLLLQDLERADRFFAGAAGIRDQLAKGTLDDGWWYECSISYNVWCASEFTQAALAYEPWGYNFRDEHVPASYSEDVALRQANGKPELSGGAVKGVPPEDARSPFGMDARVWGPATRSHREIRHLWDSLFPFIDWRGVMLGVNDSTENNVLAPRAEIGAQPFELAYYVYRDPRYAALVKLSPKRDLLWAVPELPAETPTLGTTTAVADNVGLALLRSQTPGRAQSEQINAAVHYGIHGWAHGHFDRTELLHLSRYGRSFFNPEAAWQGYEPFMYKFYVQTSVAHNMVVVDRKMQEAAPAERRLLHAGKAFQAVVVDNTARWSHPPYGGMVYENVPVKSFEEKAWREGRYVPIPATVPTYGARSAFTEPVYQRRLMVVTDDYVLIADHDRGGQPHDFESLFQMKGFEGITAASVKKIGHDKQWDTDPLSAAQFVTDADRYAVTAPAKASFTMRFGPGADNAGTRALYSEDGVLKLDVHSLWPREQEIMVGTVPENHGTEKRLFYTIRGDGRELTSGKFGSWILGEAAIDMPVAGLKSLELETRTELDGKPTLFWGSARVVLRDGRTVPLAELPQVNQNVNQPKVAGQDFFGGPIKIVGTPQPFATSAQPKNVKKPALVRVDLSKVDAVRFQATLGGDYPLGDETQRRKTYAIRAPGGPATEVRFLTVIEPHEGKPVVVRAEATDADHVRIELADGRVQTLSITGFTDPSATPVITLTEKDGKGAVLRTERTR